MPTAQRIKASTQKFTEIQNIADDIVILAGGYACAIIEIQAINFSLLSQEEQNAKMLGYASLLNSLSFPIQILIRNKKMDISQYVKELEQKIASSKSEKLKNYILQYNVFIQDLVKKSSVLDKKFYIAISFSSLEMGAASIGKKGDFPALAKSSLHAKAELIRNQLTRLNLVTKILENNDLVTIFYEMFNSDDGSTAQNLPIEETKNPFVKGVEK